MREHLGEPALRLPPVTVHAGWFARLLTKSLKVGAITLGRRIFLSPRRVERGDDQKASAPGWLMAHEALHVLQYERDGDLRFFFKYLRGYFSALRAGGRWDAAARMAAYLAIAEERAAHEAENAYRSWSERRAGEGV